MILLQLFKFRKVGDRMATKKVEAAKVEAVKEEVKKVEAPKKETTKKETAKATVKTETKAPAKKAVKKESEAKKCKFYVQYAGMQFDYDEIVEKSKSAAAAEMGKTVASVKTIDIYCKPEENAAYYVANGKVAGRVDL